MYGMVLMVAVTGSGDTASFGKHKGGCTGDAVVVSGCTGDVVGCSGSGCSGSHHIFGGRGGCTGGGKIFGGGGFLGKHKHSCDGGCSGSVAAPAGCTGTVVTPAPAPVVVAAPCAPACEPAPVCCEKEKRKGLFSRLCGKKKEKSCDTCAAPVAVAAPCSTGTVVVPPATGTTPPATMPPVTPTPKKAE